MKFFSLKYKHYFFLISALVLLYLIEGINKYLSVYTDSDLVFSKIIKLVVITFCTINLLFHRHKTRKYLLFITILIVGFTVGQSLLDPNFNEVVVINFFRYLFPIIIFLYANEYLVHISDKKLLLEVYEKIIIINSIMIIAGFIFQIPLFRTYSGQRFGYSGLLFSTATATYFYSIALSYCFLRYKQRVFNNIWRIIVFSSSLLIGTKSLYLFILFFLIAFGFYYLDKQKRIGVVIISLLGLLTISYFLPRWTYSKISLGIRVS